MVTSSLLVLGIVGAFVAFGTLASAPRERRRRQTLHTRYWSRGCAGLRWHRAFRSVPPAELRMFLYEFVDAFGFRREHALCFRPDDRILDIYRDDQAGAWSDMLQIETFEDVLRARYSVAVDFSTPGLTLGEFFAATQVEGAA